MTATITGPAGGRTGTTLLEHLAGRVCGVGFADLDEQGECSARTAFADTLGVALAGGAFDGIALARQALGLVPGRAGSLILGTGQRTTALEAGLLNGMAAHALDFDDGNSMMGGHPSALLVPTVLELGEQTGASVPEVVAAYAAGYEVLIRLARGANPAHYAKGWHPTSTLGVVGTAAAAARLLNLDAGRTATAMAIAVSHAAGVKVNFGTMTKSLHVGQAVRHGILAAELAAAGFTASPAALDAEQGFLTVYNGAENVDATAIVAGLDAPLLITTECNPIKAYACCHSTHATIDAARAITHQAGFDPSQISEVRVVVDEKRMPHTDRPVLAEALSGKFSQQYVVARALLSGTVTLADFEGEAHRAPEVLAVMNRVHVVAAPPGGRPNSFAAEVHVTTPNGSFTAHHDPDEERERVATGEPPLLWEKFADCAGRALGVQATERLASALRGFPTAGAVADLVRLAELPEEKGTQ